MDFKEEIRALLKKELNKEIVLEIPPDPTLGDVAFPCFSLAKEFKKNPASIAQELAKKIKAPFIDRVEVQGAYLNVFFKKENLAKEILSKILKEKSKYGASSIGKGKTIVIDMSSPNIAKPFGIGHLRSTMIGNAIRNLLTFQGYRVIRINHLGDWGTQFGKLIFAYEQWHTKKSQEKPTLATLHELYVRFHHEAEQHPAYEEEARIWFKKLEDGDTTALRYWKQFTAVSLVEFKKIYALLGVDFEVYSGEASFNNQRDATIKAVQKTGITEMSEGALVVNLEAYNMPPGILQKNDGATLYLTRDIAAALYRKKIYKFDKMLYEVGAEQKLHFQQLFKTLELMGHAWAKDCIHIDHGLYLGPDGKKFSTRKGKTVFMIDIIHETIDLAKKTIQEKNPRLTDKDAIAQAVGIGAIIFGDLCNDRSRDIVFDIEKFISFEGETGPYLQYTHARLCSILRKKSLFPTAKLSFDFYDEVEQEIIKQLARFPQAVDDATRQYKPHILARYLLDLAQQVNSFYATHVVLQKNSPLENARLALITATTVALGNGLHLLGIAAPEEM